MNKEKRRRYKGVITEKILYEEYVEGKKSICDIASQLGVHRQEVARYMKRFSIKSRSRSESRSLALLNGKANGKGRVYRHVTYGNLDFFKTWTSDMAYVLGVLYTDGCMHPGKNNSLGLKTTASTPSISLSQKNPEILSKVLSIIECDATIMKRERRVSGTTVAGAIWFFVLNSNVYFDDLTALGLTPKKSKTILMPQGLPKEYAPAFMRGCWDGDGSISLQKKSITAKIVSGSRLFITGMKEMIRAMTGIDGSIYKYKEAEYYTLSYCSENAREVLSFMYKGSSERTRLTRKYNTFLSHLEMVNEDKRQQ